MRIRICSSHEPHEQILHLGGEKEWKYMVQSYLACINYVDIQIGRLLNELKENLENERPSSYSPVIMDGTSERNWQGCHLEKHHPCSLYDRLARGD